NPPVTLVGGGNLTSGGEQVFFALDGGDLVGYVNVGGTSGFNDGTDTKVFTLALEETGEDAGDYTFTLHAPIDHHATGDDVEGNIAIDLNGRVTVTDSGGPATDTASIDASITVI